MRTTTSNEDIIIEEIQDNRIWIHSKSLGYGHWIPNWKLKELLLEKSKKRSF